MLSSFYVLLILLTIKMTYSQDQEQENKIESKEDCKQGECFIDGIVPKCVALTTSSYKDLKKDITQKYNELNITDISQVHCNTEYERCIDLAPESGNKKKCTNFTITNSTEKCCYMKVKYKGNSKYSCYPALKDKKEIKDIIKILKKEYVGSESISIDCNGKFISLGLWMFLLWLL